MKVFIDSNIFLDLFRAAKQKELDHILEIQEFIIITQQVVCEVNRNKSDVFSDNFKPSKSEISKGMPTIFDASHVKERKDLEASAKKIDEQHQTLRRKILQEISEHVDPISTTLTPIFSKAIFATNADIESARKRKEFGNPPGKKTDPIGDELNWEILLRMYNECPDTFVIISNDGDFGIKTEDGKIILNPQLFAELKGINADKSFHFFSNVSASLKFIKTQIPSAVSATQDQLDAEILESIKTDNAICKHTNIWKIENGRFDQMICKDCGKVLHSFLAEVDY